jgi:hypothetical protein
MLTAKEFDQLIAILPRLEGFARDRQFTSISIIKNPFHSKESEIYMCYTHEGIGHGLEITAQIGQDFEKLWGISLYEDIVLAHDRAFFKGEIFDEHLKGSEFFLVLMDANHNYVTATPSQVIDYVKRDFAISIQPPSSSDITDNSKKRRISDEKVGSNQTALISSNNIFTPVSSQNTTLNIQEALAKLSVDEYKKLIIDISHDYDITNNINKFVQIRPLQK